VSLWRAVLAKSLSHNTRSEHTRCNLKSQVVGYGPGPICVPLAGVQVPLVARYGSARPDTVSAMRGVLQRLRIRLTVVGCHVPPRFGLISSASRIAMVSRIDLPSSRSALMR
jgi:hypothetical protein